MKKYGWLVALVVCWGLYACSAEASQFSDGIGKTWSFVFSPVNCAANWLSDVVASSTKFVVCVLNNANPHNLIP